MATFTIKYGLKEYVAPGEVSEIFKSCKESFSENFSIHTFIEDGYTKARLSGFNIHDVYVAGMLGKIIGDKVIENENAN